MKNCLRLCTAVLLLGLQNSAVAGPRALGIVGEDAPDWGVDAWMNLSHGLQRLHLADLQGKVVYLLCFQSWCPGCHARGFPTLKQLIADFKDADDVAFVAVQTVFEGFSTNTEQRAWETARRYELDIPIGHDGTAGKRSVLMQRYRTGGTPWVVIIDKQGKVRWNGFHIAADNARGLIDEMRRETASGPKAIQILAASRGGQDRVGKKFPKISFDRWLVPDDQPTEPKHVKATLYRWWTDSCPYCRASLPAVEMLRRQYASNGLRIVGVYHPKPSRKVSDDAVNAAAKRFGFQGPIAVDEDWSELTKVYLSSGRRRATSVTFLVDEHGVTRFLHPGPVFFASDEPQHAQENADLRLLKRAIEALLHEDTGSPDG